ncbi:hypothetical protein ACIPLR_17150 [Herbaspirillum huttiense]|uniref:hypothetical protein n=1 Tax=Herbaspirillum huttiense TaxID=863372 RepID=UPI0032F4F6DE|nr:hypothetical protein [Burkholderia vietnamiensis]HDR8978827.1 hypothetical protein [Burkholderia vietnamiensis]
MIKTYEQNPSIAQAMLNTKKGVQPIFNQGSGADFSVYSHNSEEMKSMALDFISKKVVDKDQFIKIYIHSLPVLSDLKNSTKILFQYILMSLSEEVGKDRLYISYKDYQARSSKNPMYMKISQPTFSRCLNELLGLGILFKSSLANIYFINIAYIFNGDRLRFITEYQLKGSERLSEENRNEDLEDESDEEVGKKFNERKFKLDEPETKSLDEISKEDYDKMNNEVLDRVPLKDLEKYPWVDL